MSRRRRQATDEPPGRERGYIQELPSGSLRARVYAGVDPVTGQKYELTSLIPADHPNKELAADNALAELVQRVEEKRHPRRRATVRYMLQRHLDSIEVEQDTLDRYGSDVRVHINPLIGDAQVHEIDPENIDSLMAELRRCRIHCPIHCHGKQPTDRIRRRHTCGDRCRPHQCNPLGLWARRKIYWLLHDAFDRAVRVWRWIDRNPVADIDPPPPPSSKPEPPTTQQVATILSAAWELDTDWGMLIWTMMITGVRPVELCRVRWSNLDLEADVGVLRITSAKTHQDRSIVLDSYSTLLLTAYRGQCRARAAAAGVDLADDAYAFSPHPDHRTPHRPASVGDRYKRMVRRLGIETTIYKLRHHSATELIAGGVDIRTVAGRLGHSGGGTTTLKTYAAFINEADQRAAQGLLDRLPKPPVELDSDARAPLRSTVEPTPRGPYDVIAADLRASIRCVLSPGDQLPAMTELADRYRVAPSTVHRAVGILADAGLVTVSRGRRATVAHEKEKEGDDAR